MVPELLRCQDVSEIHTNFGEAVLVLRTIGSAGSPLDAENETTFEGETRPIGYAARGDTVNPCKREDAENLTTRYNEEPIATQGRQ